MYFFGKFITQCVGLRLSHQPCSVSVRIRGRPPPSVRLQWVCRPDGAAHSGRANIIRGGAEEEEKGEEGEKMSGADSDSEEEDDKRRRTISEMHLVLRFGPTIAEWTKTHLGGDVKIGPKSVPIEQSFSDKSRIDGLGNDFGKQMCFYTPFTRHSTVVSAPAARDTEGGQTDNLMQRLFSVPLPRPPRIVSSPLSISFFSFLPHSIPDRSDVATKHRRCCSVHCCRCCR